MKRTATVVMALIFALACSIPAKTYRLSIHRGGAEIVRGTTGEQVLVSDSGTVNSGDMVSLIDAQQASIAVESNCTILMKGPANLTLFENGNTLTATLDDGQILLDRKQPCELAEITVAAKGFSFVPIGTRAAIKTSASAQPTTAVISGKVRMEAPSGEAVVVDEGQFGSVGADGKLSTGALSPKAIESLNEWVASATNTATPAQASSKPATETLPAKEPSEVEAPPPAPDAKPAPEQGPEAVAADVNSTATGQTGEAAAENEAGTTKPSAAKVDKTPPPPQSPKWEISAGSVTVGDEQWVRLGLGVDVPIWKFGIFFDMELFIDNEGRFSDKGWNFREDWIEALSRKIRYVRFGQEGDPLFIKVGGLSSVTLGYGFIVDRFTNMLHYPDERMLGLQFDINNVSPAGITLQTLVADFKDFDRDGGIAAARLALRPFKKTEVPILSGISFGGSYAADLNQYAPARSWDYTMTGDRHDRDRDGVTDSSFYYDMFGDNSIYDTIRRISKDKGDFDTTIEHRDQWASRKKKPFGIIGGDIGIPIISGDLVSLELYAQAGIRDDKKHGWGIGAPGVALKVWRIWANAEYRRILGAFQPGYFGTYYLDERLVREPSITTKEQRLVSDTLNGVFGRLGFNIANVLIVEGQYQYMAGKNSDNKDRRFEATGSLGSMLLDRIPKLSRAEVYFYKSRIGSEDDAFFDKTPFMYFGYRTGFEIAPGAVLIWDARYGYEYNDNGDLKPSNNIIIQTAITF